MKNTNFQMIKELDAEYDKLPHKRGFISEETATLIKETLHLEEFETVLELRNLRDFTVLYLSTKNKDKDDKETISNTDKISAITHMIDIEIFNKGGEV